MRSSPLSSGSKFIEVSPIRADLGSKGFPPRVKITRKKYMTMSFLRSFPGIQLPRVLRQLEQDVETVLNVLQPGPLGIVEHQFSVAEVQEAKATVRRAIENWRRNSSLEKVASIQHSSEGTPSHNG